MLSEQLHDLVAARTRTTYYLGKSNACRSRTAAEVSEVTAAAENARLALNQYLETLEQDLHDSREALQALQEVHVHLRQIGLSLPPELAERVRRALLPKAVEFKFDPANQAVEVEELRQEDDRTCKHLAQLSACLGSIAEAMGRPPSAWVLANQKTLDGLVNQVRDAMENRQGHDALKALAEVERDRADRAERLLATERAQVREALGIPPSWSIVEQVHAIMKQRDSLFEGLQACRDELSRLQAIKSGVTGLRDRELNTVLAALRFYQQCRQDVSCNRSPFINEIAVCGLDGPSLTSHEIDDLCERLNTQ